MVCSNFRIIFFLYFVIRCRFFSIFLALVTQYVMGFFVVFSYWLFFLFFVIFFYFYFIQIFALFLFSWLCYYSQVYGFFCRKFYGATLHLYLFFVDFNSFLPAFFFCRVCVYTSYWGALFVLLLNCLIKKNRLQNMIMESLLIGGTISIFKDSYCTLFVLLE